MKPKNSIKQKSFSSFVFYFVKTRHKGQFTILDSIHKPLERSSKKLS